MKVAPLEPHQSAGGGISPRERGNLLHLLYYDIYAPKASPVLAKPVSGVLQAFHPRPLGQPWPHPLRRPQLHGP